MKSYKTALGLTLATSVCAALIACNKGGGNNSPAPVPPPVVIPQNQFQVRPFGQIPAGQMVRPRITNNNKIKYIKCYGTSLDYTSGQGVGLLPLDFPPLPFDNTKVETYELPHLHSASLGKVAVKIEPDVVDANGNATQEGTLEISVTEAQGNKLTSIKSFLDSRVKLEVDDTKNEKNVKIDCSVETIENGQMVPLYDSGNPKLVYTCNTGSSGATTTPGAVKTFTVKSKPEKLIESATDVLRLENDKEQNGDIVFVNDRKAQSRVVKVAVPFGHEFLVNSSAASASILCSAGVANATQQK